MLELSGRQIKTVAIIDDDRESRESLAIAVEDSHLKPWPIGGPLGDLDTAYQLIESKAQALICDHPLDAKGPHRFFSGAALAARNNQHDLPSILCTRFLKSDTHMPTIRTHLKHLPVICRPEELGQPGRIIEALEECTSELNGTFTPERRPWKTQAMVERINHDGTFSVSLSAWQVDEPVRVSINDIPGRWRDQIKVGFWTFVHANIGATRPEMLYIDWPDEVLNSH